MSSPMARLEYKYLLPSSRLEEVRRLILPHVEMDPYSQLRPSNDYTVRSTYWDTPALDFYEEKLAGLMERKKLRIRSYDESPDHARVFLELKRKTGNAVEKNRSLLPYGNCSALFATGDVDRYVPCGNDGLSSHENAKRFLYFVHTLMLRPCIHTIYEREAYFSKFDHRLRITFDKRLRYRSCTTMQSMFQDSCVEYALTNQFVLEVKTNTGIPMWLGRMLSRLDVVHEAVSKYAICMSLCEERHPGSFRACRSLCA
jgi:hypothetical protein